MSSFKQWMIYGGILMLTIASLTLTGCGLGKEIALGAKDNGTQLELEQGQTLAITLDSNPTTGYSWARDPNQVDDILVQVGEAEYKSKSNLIGGGGIETLRFRADAPGKTTLALIYRRPWEEGTKPAEVYTLEISVR